MQQEEFEHIAPQLRTVMFEIGHCFFRNEEDADDVAQEGLVTLWKYCQQMDASCNHKALAVRVAKHCCIDLMRRRKQVMIVDMDGKAEKMSFGPSPHEELEAAEMKAALNEAVYLLKPSERRVFQMQQLEGLSPDEISEQTHIPKSSIKSMVSAARKNVLNELQKRMKS